MTSILANNDVDSVSEILDYVYTCLTAYVLHFSLNCSSEFSCGLWGVLIDLPLRSHHRKKIKWAYIQGVWWPLSICFQ